MNVGDMVTSHLRLVRLLGQGGMGSVWVAEHLRLKTEVVVKFILGELVEHPDLMARFEREATVAAQARSRHVVQMLDHGISLQGVPYIAMELLEGEDLQARLDREGWVDPVKFCCWFSQAASGLNRAHQKGIVHRDVKPANIFLCDEDGEVSVKILDFGVAKWGSAASGTTGNSTNWGTLLGTAHYMSPEQTMGKTDIDARADLWALGVVAYHALTGSRPFQGRTIPEIVCSITNEQRPPASTINPRLPAAFDRWVDTALARNPNDRFGNAKEMATGLSRVFSVKVPPLERAVRRGARRVRDRSGSTAAAEVTLSPSVSTQRSESEEFVLPVGDTKSRWVWFSGAVGLLSAFLVIALSTASAVTTGPDLQGEAQGLPENSSRTALTLPRLSTPPPGSSAGPEIIKTRARPLARTIASGPTKKSRADSPSADSPSADSASADSPSAEPPSAKPASLESPRSASPRSPRATPHSERLARTGQANDSNPAERGSSPNHVVSRVTEPSNEPPPARDSSVHVTGGLDMKLK